LAWSKPSSQIIHFWMRAQLIKSCNMTSLWINSEWIHYTLETEIRRIYGQWNSHLQFGPALLICECRQCTVWNL
jgi:hypothetical protein